MSKMSELHAEQAPDHGHAEFDMQSDLEALKRNWLNDPCWDIEETEGFETHKAELLAFRLKTEAAWRARRERELADRALALGVPGNIALVLLIETLESKIARLEERVEVLPQ